VLNDVIYSSIIDLHLGVVFFMYFAGFLVFSPSIYPSMAVF